MYDIFGKYGAIRQIRVCVRRGYAATVAAQRRKLGKRANRGPHSLHQLTSFAAAASSEGARRSRAARHMSSMKTSTTPRLRLTTCRASTLRTGTSSCSSMARGRAGVAVCRRADTHCALAAPKKQAAKLDAKEKEQELRELQKRHGVVPEQS